MRIRSSDVFDVRPEPCGSSRKQRGYGCLTRHRGSDELYRPSQISGVPGQTSEMMGGRFPSDFSSALTRISRRISAARTAKRTSRGWPKCREPAWSSVLFDLVGLTCAMSRSAVVPSISHKTTRVPSAPLRVSRPFLAEALARSLIVPAPKDCYRNSSRDQSKQPRECLSAI